MWSVLSSHHPRSYGQHFKAHAGATFGTGKLRSFCPVIVNQVSRTSMAATTTRAIFQTLCPIKPSNEQGTLAHDPIQSLLVTQRASVAEHHQSRWKPVHHFKSALYPVGRVGKVVRAQVRAVRAAFDGQPSKAGTQFIDTEERTLKSPALPRKSENLVEPDGGVKSCQQCQRSKLVGDFERSVSTADGRSDICRACLAVYRAQNLGKELFHLALPVDEAWRLGKTCGVCGVFKELRDFTRKVNRKDGVSLYCRNCESKRRSKIDKPPVDSPQRCNMCMEIKAPTEFYIDRSKATGLSYFCRPCRKLSNLIYRSKKKEAAEVPRLEKCCRACGVVKQALEFHKDRSSSDKLDFLCKPCRITKNKEWQRRRREIDQA